MSATVGEGDLVLVITRHSVAEEDTETFLGSARDALVALAARPGHLRGWAARATDDPRVWVLVTEWESVGAYRRALSSYDVKVRAVPVMAGAYDEPTAFEVMAGDGNAAGSALAADSATVALGSASAPAVPAWGDQRGEREGPHPIA